MSKYSTGMYEYQPSMIPGVLWKKGTQQDQIADVANDVCEKKSISAVVADILDFTRQSFECMNTKELPSGDELDAAIKNTELVLAKMETMYESLEGLRLSRNQKNVKPNATAASDSQ